MLDNSGRLSDADVCEMLENRLWVPMHKYLNQPITEATLCNMSNEITADLIDMFKKFDFNTTYGDIDIKVVRDPEDQNKLNIVWPDWLVRRASP